MKHAQSYYLTALSVLFVGTVVALAAGNVPRRHGVDHCASDSGSWQTLTTGIAGSTGYALSAVDGNVCWMAGKSGTIIRTTDGGNTWSLINPGVIDTQSIHVFEGVSDSIAFASTRSMDTTYIYRTTNGGFSWSKVFSQDSGNINGIKMFNATKGIALGDPVGGLWTILKTTDAGETWFKISAEPPQVHGGSGGTAFGTLDTNGVWFSDNNWRRYSSWDGRETWGYSPDSSVAHREPVFEWWNSHCTGLAVQGLFLFGSQVYGFNCDRGWVRGTPLPDLIHVPTALVGAVGTTEFWVITDALYYTPDAGYTWTAKPPNGLNRPVKLIDIVTIGSDISGWATGTGDTVYHYRQILTGIEEHPQPIPQNFSLNHNYPNPFNPSTTIRFDLPKREWVEVVIYDILGRRIETLLSKELNPGEQTISWDATGRPSGIYFCRLKTSAGIIAKKLLLVR